MAVRRNQLSHINISGYKSIKKCNLALNKINVLNTNIANPYNIIYTRACAIQSGETLQKNFQIYKKYCLIAKN